MYRSRNRSRGGDGVKGPNSALTQFLKEEGISAESIRQKWLKQKQEDGEKESSGSKEEPEEEPIEILDVESDAAAEGSGNEDDEVSFIRRMKVNTGDSDEEEYDESTASPAPVTQRASKPLKRNASEILQKRKKRRKRAANLLDRKLHKVQTLQNLCIQRISENITRIQKEAEEEEEQNRTATIGSNLPNNDPVSNKMYSHLRDVLGGISTENLNNLAKALSKNRALNDHTLQLFLKTDLEALTFHDCSKISYQGYKMLAVFSPHLTKLSLQMCGQLNNEALLYISEKLPNLEVVHLDGPFLINEPTWQTFFGNMKGRLKNFHVSNTHRFTDKCLASLLSNCGPELVSLGLSRLDSVFNYALLPQYLTNSKFHTLVLQHPFNEEDVTDDVMINILGQIGPSLKKLVLNGCLELTDSMITNGMTPFLIENQALEMLAIEELDQITSDSLVYFFSQVKLPNLKRCSLKRCSQLDDIAILELLSSDARLSLEMLNLNSLSKLTKESFKQLKCPNLKYLNVGFVRCVDNSVIESVSRRCPLLELLEVFGDNKVTEGAKLRPGLTLTGLNNSI